MAWQKIDDQFGISKKVIRIPRKRRQRCVGLWLLAGNYSSRTLSDGVIEAHELDELDAVAADVAELIRVELWHGHGHDCARCLPVAAGDVVIHDYLLYNPSRAKVLSDREAERVRKMSQRDRKRTPGGQMAESEQPDPVPSRSRPVPQTIDDGDSLTDLALVDARDGSVEDFLAASWLELGVKNAGRVMRVIRSQTARQVSEAECIDVARVILSRSTVMPAYPESYIEKSSVESVQEVLEGKVA